MFAKCLKNRIEWNDPIGIGRHASSKPADHDPRNNSPALSSNPSHPLMTNYKTAHTPSVGACLRFFVAQLHHSGNRRISLMIKHRSKKYSDTTNIVVGRFPYRVKRSNICQCAGHNIRVNGLKRSIAIAMR